MREPVDGRGEIERGVRCPGCAAELTGRRATEDCPACGRRIAELLAREMGRLDERGCLTGATGCKRCGYDLRTMPLSAACPECGTAVAESALRMRLCDAPLRWLLILRWGMDVALVASLVAAVLPLLFLLDWTLFRGRMSPGFLSGLSEEFFRTYFFVVSVTIFVGIMMFTSHDPTLARQRRSRLLTRFFAIAALVIALAGAVAEVDVDRSIDVALIFAGSIVGLELLWLRRTKDERPPEPIIFTLGLPVGLLAWALVAVLLPGRNVEKALSFLEASIAGRSGILTVEPLMVAGVFGPLIFFGTRYLASIIARIPNKRLAWWIRWHGGISGIFLIAMMTAVVGLGYWFSIFWQSTGLIGSASAPITPPPLLTTLRRLNEFVAVVGGWTFGLMALGIWPRARFAIARAVREARESADAAASQPMEAGSMTNPTTKHAPGRRE